MTRTLAGDPGPTKQVARAKSPGKSAGGLLHDKVLHLLQVLGGVDDVTLLRSAGREARGEFQTKIKQSQGMVEGYQ